MADGNGEAPKQERDELVDVLVLQLDRRTMAMGFDGDVWERIVKHDEAGLEIALNMLTQATRQLDLQYRLIATIKTQQAMKAAAEEARLRADLMSRGH